MYSDIKDYVNNCSSCAKSRGTSRHSQSKLKLFPAKYPLESVAMGLVGPLPKTATGKRFIFVIMDRFSKVALAITIKEKTAPHIASLFMSNLVYPYSIPGSKLTDNGPQFISEFFEFICPSIGVKRNAITAYHAQSNGQTERYNQTLETRLRHFVSERQDDWDRYVQSLTYAYNTQVHVSTGTTPFSLTLMRHPPSTKVETFQDDGPNLNELPGTKAVLKKLITRQVKVVTLF